MKKRFVVLILLGLLGMSAAAQDAVPTLVPPTPVPVEPLNPVDALLSTSAVERIRQEGLVRVGVLYNEPPYSYLSISGEVTGFDADLARALAELWGVELEFIQVTRPTAIEMLRSQRIDLLLGAQVHQRELDPLVEFSQTYRLGQQSMMTLADDPAEVLANMTNRRVGYVLGTEGERALQAWQSLTGLSVQAQPYLTLDRAFVALFAGEVEGVVARHERLLRVAVDYLDAVKLLDEPVLPEPYAVVFQRGDSAMRYLLNRSLQFLLEEGRLTELHNEYFPGDPFNQNVLPVWENLGEDAPQLGNVDTSIRYPQQYVVPRLQAERRLRVAGLPPLPPDAADSARRLDLVTRQVVDEMALRWGVQVEYVSGDPFELLELGQADLAVSLRPDWAYAHRVDFTMPYVLFGDRLMVETNSQIDGFGSMNPNTWIGLLSNDPDSQDRAQAWADQVSKRVRFASSREENAASFMLDDDNVDVVYGSSLSLIQHLQNRPTELRLTDRWYSRNYLTMAIPRNDHDFRLLVEYTLQEMQRDGALARAMSPALPPGTEAPRFDYWPGPSVFLGFTLG